jgi:hypothetical protein
MFIVSAMLIWLNGCTTISGTECAWAEAILPSKDDVLTRGTAEQIVAHNEKVQRFCSR